MKEETLTSNQYCIERNKVVADLRALADRECRKLAGGDLDNQESGTALAALAWAIQHLNGLPEHWVAVERASDETTPVHSSISSGNRLRTNIDMLRSLIDFAYKQGYPEHGYDVLGEALAQFGYSPEKSVDPIMPAGWASMTPDQLAGAVIPSDCDCGTFCHASRGGLVLPLGARCRRASENGEG